MSLGGGPGPGDVALVTGANKGIGFAIAAQLARLGLVVLVGARDAARGERAAAELRGAGLDARFVSLDVTDRASITRAAASIEAAYGRLDVLVNNAAVKLEWHPAPPSECALETILATFATNVFGTIAVIQALLPLLRRSSAGRIVNLSSGLASLSLSTTPGTPFQAKPLLAYSTSKAALNSITVQFANELRGTPIKVNAADPGYTNTDMTHRDGRRTPEQAAQVAVRLATLPADGATGGFFDERGTVPW